MPSRSPSPAPRPAEPQDWGWFVWLWGWIWAGVRLFGFRLDEFRSPAVWMRLLSEQRRLGQGGIPLSPRIYSGLKWLQTAAEPLLTPGIQKLWVRLWNCLPFWCFCSVSGLLCFIGRCLKFGKLFVTLWGKWKLLSQLTAGFSACLHTYLSISGVTFNSQWFRVFNCIWYGKICCM